MSGVAVPLIALQGELPGRLVAGDPEVLAILRAAFSAGPGSDSGGRLAAVVLGAQERPLGYDAVALATSLTARVPGLPVIVASDGERDHPYNAARRLLSLDHLSGGRAGVLFRNGSSTAAHTAERIRAIRALWNSWPRESLVADRESGVYAHTGGIRAVDHSGPGFRIRGALNSPSSIQGEPVSLWQAGTAEDVDTASGLVDLVVPGDAALVPVDSAAALDGALAAAPPGTGEHDTLRELLGLPARSYDLSDKPLAFGATHA